MKWTDENYFALGGHTFFSCSSLQDFWREIPEDHLVIAKSRAMLEVLYDRLAHLRGGNIVELGVFRGGSTAWLNEIFEPKKIVAFEFSKEPAAALERYIEHSQNGDVVRSYYGANQKHTRVLQNTLRGEFGTELLDFVIDDASHLFEETRASFNVLFPRLRPGGIFVIEDWGWAHKIPENGTSLPPHYIGTSPLTTLVMEAIMCSAQSNGLVDNVYVDSYSAYIQRGQAELEMTDFDISSSFSVTDGLRFDTGFEKLTKDDNSCA